MAYTAPEYKAHLFSDLESTHLVLTHTKPVFGDTAGFSAAGAAAIEVQARARAAICTCHMSCHMTYVRARAVILWPLRCVTLSVALSNNSCGSPHLGTAVNKGSIGS